MNVPIVSYEDNGWQKFLPLTYLRAACQLICGAGSLLERVGLLAFSRAPLTAGDDNGNGRASSVEVWCRPLLAEFAAEQCGLDVNHPRSAGTLFLNGRGLWSDLPPVDRSEAAWVGTAGPDARIACVWADRDLARSLAPEVFLDEVRSRAALASLPRRDVGECVRLFEWPWEIIHHNSAALIEDGEFCTGRPAGGGIVYPGAYLLNENAIHIGRAARIKPCVVIDAEKGPVWIGENVTVLPHSYVQGPACIGDGSLIQPGAVVHEGTTIGPRCKVGGEIEASILQGFSNKQHDGFLGHSYVGSWVNIAADCINSDLKNTYGTVRVPINGREVDTGEMFVGMLVGDHSKTGINVSFPTGAVIGFCSSVFTPRSPKFVPSFAWINGEKLTRYDEGRGVALARKVMARRDRSMSAAEERAFRSVRRQALVLEHQPQVRLERSA